MQHAGVKWAFFPCWCTRCSTTLVCADGPRLIRLGIYRSRFTDGCFMHSGGGSTSGKFATELDRGMTCSLGRWQGQGGGGGGRGGGPGKAVRRPTFAGRRAFDGSVWPQRLGERSQTRDPRSRLSGCAERWLQSLPYPTVLSIANKDRHYRYWLAGQRW